MEIFKPLFMLISFILMSSCFSTKYMVSETYLYLPPEKQDNLLVFLPGRGSDLNDFQESGLLGEIRAGGIPADCVSADATMPYYIDMSLLIRLQADVFGKPELTNYRNIWLIGNSMGSIGAVLYARSNPGKIKGIIFLGPYLGEGAVPDEISRAGGLSNWDPEKSPDPGYIRDIWAYLKKCFDDAAGEYPRLVFLAGTDDRFHKTQDLLARALPPDHVFYSPGGHDWDAWNAAFDDFLKSGLVKKYFSTNKK